MNFYIKCSIISEYNFEMRLSMYNQLVIWFIFLSWVSLSILEKGKQALIFCCCLAGLNQMNIAYIVASIIEYL